jgi:hypothetical protein
VACRPPSSAEAWSARLTADILHLLRFEVEAGRVQETPGGVRVGPFLVVTVATAEAPQMHVAVVKDGEGPVDRTYTAAIGEDPLSIAYAVVTFLGFKLDAEKRDNDVG